MKWNYQNGMAILTTYMKNNLCVIFNNRYILDTYYVRENDHSQLKHSN